MARVLIGPATLAGVTASYAETLRKGGFELVYPPKAVQLKEDEVIEQLRGVQASLAGSEPYSARVIEANPQLKIIARMGVGYDAVDVPAATARGIPVTIAPGTNQDAVAEHTFMLMLALAKSLVSQHQTTMSGRWERRANLPLRGRTLGIAGLGRIGKAVALRGAAFGMRLLAYESYQDKEFAAKHGVTFVPFERLLRESDYVTLHMPLDAHSKQLINKQTLALMKPTAFLVNTARGGLVNEPDLAQALKDRRIAGAGIDVFEEEPPGPHALFGLDNVVVTPHTAGVDLQSRDDMAQAAAQAIVDLSQGRWPEEKVVNPEAKSRFHWA